MIDSFAFPSGNETDAAVTDIQDDAASTVPQNPTAPCSQKRPIDQVES